MNYVLKGVSAEELSFKLNKIKLDSASKFDIKPSFSRQVKNLIGNEKFRFVALSVKVESTTEDPKPFNLNVSLVGLYEVELSSPEEERSFVIKATQELYVYLRSAVLNLTAQAYVSPLNLPVINGPLFPEDRDVKPGVIS